MHAIESTKHPLHDFYADASSFSLAKLVLETGKIFYGYSTQKSSFFGEIVFTTGMVGYVESLTDPSYTNQILTFTYPLIGNYGVCKEEKWESKKITASGVVVSDASFFPTHYSSRKSLLDWLNEQEVPLIMGIDTRALTKYLRSRGTCLGCICPIDQTPKKFINPNEEHLVAKISPKKQILCGKGTKRVIVVDCGIKENILRKLKEFPIEILHVGHDYDYSEQPFDGIFLSNGPGNPELCVETVTILRKALQKEKPVFGICLGTQILALAIGCTTYKLKFGHRSQNQPCLNIENGTCILTSQNHGYAIDANSLPNDWEVTFRNLNDQSVEGIRHKYLPFSAVQFHPEHCPGPMDADYLFEEFYQQL